MGCVSSNSAADDAAPVNKNPVGGNAKKPGDVSVLIPSFLTSLIHSHHITHSHTYLLIFILKISLTELMKDLPNNFKSRYTLGDDLGSGAYSVVKVHTPSHTY